ncbi:hypothetical protein [Herbaspirillum sp. meg3]|uniref:hypothetical protein n=1 Tax=Herbaspirillum sp. meg3 TaxID=2025949 RepID=UPI0012FE3012|nr:hypothetical protein [Herbaspirillum sp. meg3]
MISHIHIRYFHPAENPGSVQAERHLHPLADGGEAMTFRLYDPERQKNAAMPGGMTALKTDFSRLQISRLACSPL